MEVRAFAFLARVFDKRGWRQPYTLSVPERTTVAQLLERLDLPPREVEAVMVNGRVVPWGYKLREGDRVGLIPPGTPGPYRVLLGFFSPSRGE
ncbi:MoaD/ThiS family protein [Desulfothermobacter acidiphilus]|uniref:MoaD/ThiS family protein n=1 Tax=Desulfothermobacter acidiphilus TaxID=1938353 RepID=UPI003F8BA3F6